MIDSREPKAAREPAAGAAPSSSVLARLLSFPAVLMMSLMLVLALFASNAGPGRDVSDPDIWWHLANAHQLVTTGHFMQQDIYSFTLAGKPWINFEWLAELPYYAAYQSFGLRGLFLVSLALGELIILGVYLLCYMRSRDVKAAFLASFVAVVLACISLGPRTLLYGWLFLVVELAVLWSFKPARRRVIWVLPPLFLLWVNMHGSWLLGFIILIMYTGCAFIRGQWGAVRSPGLARALRPSLLVVLATCIAVLFLNPYGWRLPLYPFTFAASQQLNVKYVDEWASLDLHAFFGKFVMSIIILLAVTSVVRKRTWKLFDLLVLLFAIYCGLTYTRFIFMTGLVLAPFVAVELRGVLGPYERHLERPWFNALALAVLAAIIIWRLPTDAALKQHRDETFPIDAIAHLQQLPAGHVFNGYEWGGYIIHATPQIPVFIDSRADLFVEHGVFSDYVDATKGWQSFETLDKYNIRYVLLPPNTAMSYILAHSKDWHTEYTDARSVLFARNS